MSDLIHGDNVQEMSKISTQSIDLVVTSPPYDNLRTYGGKCEWDFKGVAYEIYRVLKPGGVCCWNVGDAVVDGSETLTAFKQAIYFKDNAGFRVHDTMLYAKTNGAKPDTTRYNQCFEYIFVLSKGKPVTANLIKDKPNVTAGKTALGRWTVRQKDGSMQEREYRKSAMEFGVRPNIWVGLTRGQEEACQALNHPAMMPKWLARDLILSWSNPGETVLDPFCGSGTTVLEAHKAQRVGVGIDSNADYIALAKQTLERETAQTMLV